MDTVSSSLSSLAITASSFHARCSGRPARAGSLGRTVQLVSRVLSFWSSAHILHTVGIVSKKAWGCLEPEAPGLGEACVLPSER